MHKSKSPKTHSSIYSKSPAPNPLSPLAYRPFGSQLQKASVAPKTQTDVENEVFAQQKMEATRLEIQAKYGSITPEGQERLTVLQAKMDGLLNSRLEHARRFGHNIANIPLHRPDTPTPIQAKLTIGEPGDKYEQEADETARQVVQRIHQPQREKLQRESLPEEVDLVWQMKPEGNIQKEGMPEEDGELQMKPMVQRALDGGMAAFDLETSIQQARGSGQPLADSTKSQMEQAFGADFSGVKVHTDTQADQLNQSIQAKAFTTGQDVFFRQGAYEPGSRGGQELLAHELTHVVQQIGGAVQGSKEPEKNAAQLYRRTEKELVKKHEQQTEGISHEKVFPIQRNRHGDKSSQNEGNKDVIIQRTAEDVLHVLTENGVDVLAHNLNVNSTWLEIENALLHIVVPPISSDAALAEVRRQYFQNNEQNLPTFRVRRAQWPNIAEHTQAYIDQGEDANGGVILTYMATRAVNNNINHVPTIQKLIDLGVIRSNRDLNRHKSTTNNNHLVASTRYAPGTQTQTDEFPYASTYEGGSRDTSIHEVPALENGQHGGAMAAFYNQNGMKDGYQYRVVVE